MDLKRAKGRAFSMSFSGVCPVENFWLLHSFHRVFHSFVGLRGCLRHKNYQNPQKTPPKPKIYPVEKCHSLFSSEPKNRLTIKYKKGIFFLFFPWNRSLKRSEKLLGDTPKSTVIIVCCALCIKGGAQTKGSLILRKKKLNFTQSRAWFHSKAKFNFTKKPSLFSRKKRKAQFLELFFVYSWFYRSFNKNDDHSIILRIIQ